MSYNGCHGYWHLQISSKKDLFSKLQHKVNIMYSSLTFFLKNVKLAGTFSMKKRQKCKNCGLKNGGRGYELAI